MGVTQYIGSRYMPIFADPPEHSSAKTYEPLTIVLHEGNSYTSKQFVPKGIQITNEAYWAETGNYNAQVEQYRREAYAVQQALDAVKHLIPSTDFNDENTVKDYIDNAISSLYKNDLDFKIVKIGDCNSVVMKFPKNRFKSRVDVTMDGPIQQNEYGRVTNPDTVLNYAKRNNPFVVSNICPSTCMRFENQFYGTDAPMRVGENGIFGQKTADSDVTVEPVTRTGTMADLTNWYTCNIQWPVIVHNGFLVAPTVAGETYATSNPLPCYGYNATHYFLFFNYGRSLVSLGANWYEIALYAISIGVDELLMMDGGGSQVCIANGNVLTPNLNTNNDYRKQPMCLVIEPIEKATPAECEYINGFYGLCQSQMALDYMFQTYQALIPSDFSAVTTHTIVTNPDDFSYVTPVMNKKLSFVQEGNYDVITPIDEYTFAFKVNKPINNGFVHVEGSYRLPSGVTPPANAQFRVVRDLYENDVVTSAGSVLGRTIFTPVDTSQKRGTFSFDANIGTCRPIEQYDTDGSVIYTKYWVIKMEVPNWVECRDITMTIHPINYNVS